MESCHAYQRTGNNATCTNKEGKVVLVLASFYWSHWTIQYLRCRGRYGARIVPPLSTSSWSNNRKVAYTQSSDSVLPVGCRQGMYGDRCCCEFHFDFDRELADSRVLAQVMNTFLVFVSAIKTISCRFYNALETNSSMEMSSAPKARTDSRLMMQNRRHVALPLGALASHKSS